MMWSTSFRDVSIYSKRHAAAACAATIKQHDNPLTVDLAAGPITLERIEWPVDACTPGKLRPIKITLFM